MSTAVSRDAYATIKNVVEVPKEAAHGCMRVSSRLQDVQRQARVLNTNMEQQDRSCDRLAYMQSN